MDSNIIRKAFVMSIYPEFHHEYKKRHDEIWPELMDVLKNMAQVDILFFR
ncbi:L-rhamnose mutarotase [Vibrio algarum]|uniref:L-rhamnose mutarotase n=1 Tax=Vibrio algarum TaxID=3020714 RepID=A0ABT4YUZ8_9VIBR|nr:L-rhamnose mutarotase [Vibrio sp. KJ40-1]MDB1125207.1 L-rhamnose mutarotase [Vibrio sp. KJ40-1]